MPKRNREKLMEQSFYDLLCSMNNRAMPRVCVIQMLNDTGMRDRCERYTNITVKFDDCNKCIADYLNEYQF